MRRRPIQFEQAGFAILLCASAILLFFGWRFFFHLTDDAHIAFRYVSNSILGHGYVWNPPPFAPVEGYTSFLWVVILDLTWRVTGILPTVAANGWSLLFSFLTLVVGLLMLRSINRHAGLRGVRLLLVGLAFTGILTNRTFLAWTSSGLETAMFNCFLLAWIHAGLNIRRNPIRHLSGVALFSALIYLTRPDGLLFFLATLLIGAVVLVHRRQGGGSWAAPLAALSPSLLVPVHLLWRRSFYGAWLPNTYHAKTVSGELQLGSGWQYLLSFVIEYSLFIWLALLVVLTIRRAKPFIGNLKEHLAAVVTIGAVVLHLSYYTFLVGGDHFEYRVYSHTIVLVFVSAVWALHRLRFRAVPAVATLSLLVVLSWPIPWIHLAATPEHQPGERLKFIRISVADAVSRQVALPAPLQNYLKYFDRLQRRMIARGVCIRFQSHRAFHQYLIHRLPTREEGLALESGGYPVLDAASVGVISWVLPRVNIIDRQGLNDRIIARNREQGDVQVMGHWRLAPKGYLASFYPNVKLPNYRATVIHRTTPLTEHKIRACEAYYSSLVRLRNRSTTEQDLAPRLEILWSGMAQLPEYSEMNAEQLATQKADLKTMVRELLSSDNTSRLAQMQDEIDNYIEAYP